MVESVGERLRSARKQKGLTQAELAERAQVSRDIVAKLEQGQRMSARMATLQRLATALDCELSALMGHVDSKPSLPRAGSGRRGEDPAEARLAEALERARQLPAGDPPRPTALYRYFDDADLLLYIGIADHLAVRQRAHVAGSSWMDFAARATIARYPTREEAVLAEAEAIVAEHPLFNYQYNNTPQARLRLVEYLIEHGRTDLLAPSVSRGRNQRQAAPA